MGKESEGRLVRMRELLAAAGDLPAVIRVRNICLSLKLGAADAWGLIGQEQTVLVSVDVGLRKPFKDSASLDVVGVDTVHYGHLAKAIRQHLVTAAPEHPEDNSVARDLLKVTLDLLRHLARVDGEPADPEISRLSPLAQSAANIRYLSVTIHLPKATLLGRGVSTTAAQLFDDELRLWALNVTLHEISIPTVVGVNEKERHKKQLVTVDLELDKYPHDADMYAGVYETIVKVLSSPNFQVNFVRS